MRANLEEARAFGLKHWAEKHTVVTMTLTSAFALLRLNANVFFLDPGGTDRSFVLPEAENGLYFYLMNVGSSGSLEVISDIGAAVCTILPNASSLVICSDTTWRKFPGLISPLEGGFGVGASRTLTGAVEAISLTDVAVKINRVGNMTITLPSAELRLGLPIRYADISTPSPDHTITWQRTGSDTILTPGVGPAAASFESYHNGTDPPRGVIEPWDNGLWVFT